LNLALTGFMGAGKTTVGKRLAKLLALPFVDTDALVEREHGPIERIFAREGEARFREYESRALTRVGEMGACVVAVGGGAVLSAANRGLLRAQGAIVHLAASPAMILARVGRARPLLGPEPTLAGVQALLDERQAAYADCDFSIAVAGRSTASLAREIAGWYGERCGARARM
jgi:shikimate kinase